jgi:hypothetical protein
MKIRPALLLLNRHELTSRLVDAREPLEKALLALDKLLKELMYA